jgi:membrane protease YdiL (CAAX protease family)
MSQTASFTHIADMFLLAAGGSAVLAVAILLTASRRWADALRLPAAPENQLEAIDLLIGLAALMFLPGVLKAILDLLTGAAPTTQPAPDALPTAQSIVANSGGQIVASVVILVLGWLRFAGGLSGWGLQAAGWPRRLLAAFMAYIVIWPVCAGLLDLTVRTIQLFHPNYAPPEHNAIRLLQASNEPRWLYGLTIFSALVLAPIVEELFFRGLLQPAVAKWLRSPWKAVLFCGCAFGMFHFSVGHTIPALAFFGIALGYCYAKTRSLTLVVLLHAVFNGKTLLWLMLGR